MNKKTVKSIKKYNKKYGNKFNKKGKITQYWNTIKNEKG